MYNSLLGRNWLARVQRESHVTYEYIPMCSHNKEAPVLLPPMTHAVTRGIHQLAHHYEVLFDPQTSQKSLGILLNIKLEKIV